MGQNITNCGNCGEINFCGWYRKDAPKDSYGRIDRDYMDSNPVAYCSEECRDTAAACEASETTIPAAALDAAQQAVRDKLAGPLFHGSLLDLVARELATAVLAAALPQAEAARHPAAEAKLNAVRAFAADMRTWCSPHGVAANYADRLEAVLNA